jgi:hypothetical protein
VNGKKKENFSLDLLQSLDIIREKIMLTVGKDYLFLIIGDNNCWGKGKTETEAKKSCFNPKQYLVYLVDPSTRVNNMGDLIWASEEHGKEPILLKTVKKRK